MINNETAELEILSEFEEFEQEQDEEIREFIQNLNSGIFLD